MTPAAPLPWDAGLRLAADAVRAWIESFRWADAAPWGEPVASVAVTLGSALDGRVHARGTLALLRRPDGTHRLGVEVPGSFVGYRLPGDHRWSFSLDEVLDVRWEPGLWAGALVVAPLEPGELRALPGRPRGEARLRVARRDRAAAEAFARAVALADLPA